jgi:hypothetical protein
MEVTYAFSSILSREYSYHHDGKTSYKFIPNTTGVTKQDIYGMHSVDKDEVIW